ncbi:DDB1- and CUL4-associated factor 12 [Papilio machaon]|uniref:DDB1-and CUL4-associated factor 12 n=1 Tax=Papilio machaon TaxID=76193 RepID=A0A194RM44_PAPMA|nr:DDB1- and CUL4-associated factor 12 [Papilio machaon]
MAQTVRRAVEGRYPSCYLPNRIKERRNKARALRLQQQSKPDKPEDFVCYSDSDSEEETPAQQHRILSTSYNFVDYVRSREIQAPELMVYDVRSRSLDAIPTLRPRAPWPGAEHQTGIHALQINPSRTLLATGARNSCELAIYSLPTLDPVCVGEAHKDWILDVCWLDDEFVVSGSRDSRLALWRAPPAAPRTPPHHDYVAPLAVREWK